MEETKVDTATDTADQTSEDQTSDSGVFTEKTLEETPVEKNLKFNNDWIKELPDNLRQLMDKYKNPIDLLKAHQLMKQALEKRLEDFTDADWQTIMEADDRLNDVPSSADKYELKFSPYTKNSTEVFDDKGKDAWKTIAHSLRLNKDQANGVYNFFTEVVNTLNRNEKAKREQAKVQAINYLKDDFGDAYNDQMNFARIGAEEILPSMIGLSPEEIKQGMIDSGLDYNPFVIKTLAALAKLKGNTPRPGYGNLTKTDANLVFSQLSGDDAFMSKVANRHHPDHDKALNHFYAIARRSTR